MFRQMSDGELAAVFKGLAGDSEQAAGNISDSMAGLGDKTAAIEEANLGRSLGTEEQATSSFTSISGDDTAAEDSIVGSSADEPTAPAGAAPPADPPPPPPGDVAPSSGETEPSSGGTEPSSSETTPSPADAEPSSGSISDRLDPDGSTPVDTPSDYQPSDAEQALQAKKIVDTTPLDPGGHANDAYVVTYEDGTRGIYKPVAGEDASLRQGIPGGLADREVAASRMDEAFGFGRVPTTTKIDGAQGSGSVQQWVDSTGSKALDEYPRTQQEQMAVLDYVTGNTDRHTGNFVTDAGGNIVAIDHGYSFPETPDPRFGIRSDFVQQNVNTPLSDEVMQNVRAVDPGQVRTTLQASGLSDQAVDGVVSRLGEVQSRGMITGENWPGIINGSWIN